MSVRLDVGHRGTRGIEPDDFDASRHRIFMRQIEALTEGRAPRGERETAGDQGPRGASRPWTGAAELAWDHDAPSTLARTLPCASRASMTVPGVTSAALRRISPPSTLTMA